MISTQTIFQSPNKKLFIYILYTLIIIYPLAFIWQCGDLTDSGFFAVSYQNFFSELTHQRTSSISFLSDLAGASWYKMFPSLGIIGFKLLYLLVLYLILIMVYKIFNPYFKSKSILLIAIFSGLVFALRSTPFIFNRDITSWLFLTLSAYSLVKAETKGKISLYILSGFSIGLAILARFPNIVLLLLLPAVLLYHNWDYSRNNLIDAIKAALHKYLWIIAGFAILCAFFFGILEIFNLREIYVLNLNSIKAENESSYSLVSLIQVYVRDLLFFLPHLLSVTALILLSALLTSTLNHRKIFWIVLFWFFLIFVAAYVVYAGFNYEYNLKYLAPAICAVPIVYSLIKKDEYSFITALFIILTLTQITGTNTGLFLKMLFGMTLIIPLSILILTKNYNVNLHSLNIDFRQVFSIAFAILIILSIYARLGWIYHVGEGLSIRIQAIHQVEHKLMKGIFTTRHQAEHIKLLTTAIDSNLRSNNSLFIYGHQPMIYFLSEQKPPISKYWLTNNYVQEEEVFRALEEHVLNDKKWPLIVDTHQKIFEGKAGNQLEEFLLRNNYTIVADEPGFTIWNISRND